MTMTASSIGTSIANVYVSSGNTAVTFLSITNVSSSSVLFDLSIVPPSTVASNTHVVLSNLVITSDSTHQFYAGGEKLLLDSGASVQCYANAVSSLFAVISYTSI